MKSNAIHLDESGHCIASNEFDKGNRESLQTFIISWLMLSFEYLIDHESVFDIHMNVIVHLIGIQINSNSGIETDYIIVIY